MNLKEYRTFFIQELSTVYDVMESENIFHILLEDWSGIRRFDISTNPETGFSDDEIARYNTALERLKKHEPIQYITGVAHFYGLEFSVNPFVLIPRPETEELVDWIIKDFEFHPNPKILDIGTGSGCIPVTLATNLKTAAVSAIDVSEKALEIARKNASANEASVDFILTDILKSENLPEKYDVIVSNPPYVRNLEKTEIRQNVLEHEPHLALFVEDTDALVFYRKIAELAINHLSENGKLYFEINQYLGEETMGILRNIGFKNVELRKDLQGNDRMIKAF